MEAYSCLISTLQLMLSDVVYNKLSCLERAVDGIVPNETYASDPASMLDDKDSMNQIIMNFVHEHPLRARNTHFMFENVKAGNIIIQRYNNLSSFLEMCTKNKAVSHG